MLKNESLLGSWVKVMHKSRHLDTKLAYICLYIAYGISYGTVF